MRRCLAVLAILLLTGCSASSGAGANGYPPASSTPAAVPWLDEPVQVGIEPTATATPTARPCTAADLPATATHRPTGGITQTDSTIIGVTNTSQSSCTLRGRPDVMVTDAGGALQPAPSEP